jgi:hypothetical protein
LLFGQLQQREQLLQHTGGSSSSKQQAVGSFDTVNAAMSLQRCTQKVQHFGRHNQLKTHDIPPQAS